MNVELNLIGLKSTSRRCVWILNIVSVQPLNRDLRRSDPGTHRTPTPNGPGHRGELPPPSMNPSPNGPPRMTSSTVGTRSSKRVPHVLSPMTDDYWRLRTEWDSKVLGSSGVRPPFFVDVSTNTGA